MAMIFNVGRVKKMTEFRISREFIKDLDLKVVKFIKDTLIEAEEAAKERKQKTLLI